MPDELLRQAPAWVLWLVAAGALAGAGLTITRALQRASGGMKTMATWIGGIVRAEVVRVIQDETLDPTQVSDIVRSELHPLAEELQPNSGKSLRDAVDRIEQRVEHHISDLELHRQAHEDEQ